jgi:hypothetical protein
MNSIGIIAPYKYEGIWVFDDPAVGLTREPFVAGIDTMIDQLVASIPNAATGFRLLFSATPFPRFYDQAGMATSRIRGQLVSLFAIWGRGVAVSGTFQVFRPGSKRAICAGGAKNCLSRGAL